MLIRSRTMFRAPAAVPALGIISAAWLLAGGFGLDLGNPAASHDSKARNAVLLVRPVGCIDAVKTQVSATAEGIVNGKRRSLPLKLVALDAPATYAVMREWPSEGAWIVRIHAEYDGRQIGALVPISAEGLRRDQARIFGKAVDAEQVESLLRQVSATMQAQAR